MTQRTVAFPALRMLIPFAKMIARAALLVFTALSHVAIAGPFAYITGGASGELVTVIDVASNAVVTTVPLGTISACCVAVNVGGGRAYISTDTTVTVLDTASNSVVATIPIGFRSLGIAINPGGTRVYVSNWQDAKVSVIDTSTNAVVSVVNVFGSNLEGIAVDSSGSRLYVASQSGGISVIDTSTNTFLNVARLSSNVIGIAINPSGTQVYAAVPRDSVVSVVDTATLTVIANIPVTGASLLALNPAGSRLYVANQGTTNSLTVIDTASNSAIASIPLGGYPAGIAVDPSGGKVFVTMSDLSRVFVIDTATNSLAATIATDVSPGSTLSAFIGGPLVSPVTCSIGVSTSVGANTFVVLGTRGSLVVPPLSSARLDAFCNGVPINAFAWSTGESTPGIAITTPAAGLSAPYSVTLTTPSGAATVSVTLQGPPVGAPVCAIAPASPAPLPAVNPPPFPVLTSDPVGSPPGSCNTAAAVAYTWSDGTGVAAKLVSGQGTPTATYQLSASQPGRGAFVFMTPANSFGSGPQAAVFVEQSPIDVAPTVLTFPTTAPLTQSAPQSIAVRNLGDSQSIPLTITSSGAPFTMTHNCPSPLPPMTSCTIDIRFAPSVPGAGTGSVLVQYPFFGTQSFTISLTGNSVGAPAVSLTPSSLAFAARTVSTTSTAQTVTLANTGSAALAIASITVNGDFAFVSTCGVSLAPGASCTIDVTFTPLVVGARSGTLIVTHNAAGSPHSIPLTGTGLSTSAPVADIRPFMLDFPAQPVGSDSAPQTLTVTNSGTAPLTFTSIGISGEFALIGASGTTTASQCPVTLAPTQSCEIHVAFRPTAPNLREGVLSIATNAGKLVVRVIGTGLLPAPPQLSLATSLAFGGQPVGTRSAGHAFAIRNTSEILATITELSTTGDFSVSDACTTIAAGAACSPLVTFQPTAVGPRAGTLTVRTLRDADPYTASLTGTGEENLLPVLQLSATSIGFGNTFIGQTVTREVTLHNAGTAPLAISSILAGGIFFSDLPCVTTIGPGASCTVRVSFLPGSPGTQGALLEIVSNAAGSPHSVNLSGTGCFVPTPSRARFGLLLCGS